MNSAEQLVEKIKERVRKTAEDLVERAITSNKEWTKACLCSMVELGVSEHFDVSPNPITKQAEWLYDMIWCKAEEKEGAWRMIDVVLALESEWSRYLSEIRYDFQKLIQAKARIKVLISDCISEDDRKSLITDIECFEQGNMDEIYLFAEYNHEKKSFDFKTYTEKDGLKRCEG